MSTGDVPNTLLHVLQRHYAQQWSIRRHGGLWIATATRQQITHAPTLIEEDVEVFAHQVNASAQASPVPRLARGRGRADRRPV